MAQDRLCGRACTAEACPCAQCTNGIAHAPFVSICGRARLKAAGMGFETQKIHCGACTSINPRSPRHLLPCGSRRTAKTGSSPCAYWQAQHGTRLSPYRVTSSASVQLDRAVFVIATRQPCSSARRANQCFARGRPPPTGPFSDVKVRLLHHCFDWPLGCAG